MPNFLTHIRRGMLANVYENCILSDEITNKSAYNSGRIYLGNNTKKFQLEKSKNFMTSVILRLFSFKCS